MLLRGVQFLAVGKSPAKLLGWMLSREERGFRSPVNPQLIYDVIGDSGLGVSGRGGATVSTKERVVDETPLDAKEHSYYRAQVGRLLFLAALRPDLQHAVGQLSR